MASATAADLEEVDWEAHAVVDSGGAAPEEEDSEEQVSAVVDSAEEQDWVEVNALPASVLVALAERAPVASAEVVEGKEGKASATPDSVALGLARPAWGERTVSAEVASRGTATATAFPAVRPAVVN